MKCNFLDETKRYSVLRDGYALVDRACLCLSDVTEAWSRCNIVREFLRTELLKEKEVDDEQQT